MTGFIPQILPHLWQSTVFGLVIVAVILALPKASARVRYIVGWFGLLKFFLPLGWIGTTMPTIGLMTDAQLIANIGLRPLMLPEFVVHAHQPVMRAATMPTASGGTGVDMISLVMWLWLGVAAFAMIAGLARTLWYSRRVVLEAAPFDPDSQLRLNTLARRIGVDPAGVRGYFTNSPMLLGVIGLFRSRILVPRDLVQSLERDEADAVLLHELAHVRRRDNLWRLLQLGVVGLFWFHPLVWWLHLRMLWESERACDELVLSAQRNKQAYAGVLLKAARFALGLGVPGVSGMSRMRLQPRIRAILNHQTRKDSAMKTTGLLLLLCGTLAVCAVAAQTPPANEPNITDEERDLFNRTITALNDETRPRNESVHAALKILEDRLAEEGAPSAAVDFNVGNLHVELGELEEAIENYKAALEKFPRFMRAQRLLTIMLAQTGKYSECIESGEQLLEEFADDADGVVNGLIGLSYLNLAQPEKAIDYYEVALERSPSTKDWRFGLARACMETERYDRVIDLLQAYLAENPDDQEVWYYMANAAFGRGDEETAAKYWTKGNTVSGVSVSSGNPIDSNQYDVAPVQAGLISHPIYPKETKENRIEGRVVARFTITRTAEIADVEIESATHPEFERAVPECFKTWNDLEPMENRAFQPGTKDGKPASVRMRLPFVFNPVATADKSTQ